MLAGRPMRRRSPWRAALCALLDPRPRWWGKAWFWFLMSLAGYFWLDRTLDINKSGTLTCQWLVIESPDGQLEWLDGKSRAGVIWQATGDLRYATGPDYEFETAEVKVTNDPTRTKQPATADQEERVVAWISDHSGAET